MWLYGWEPLMVSHHCAKFVGHSHSTSGDIMFLVVEEQDCTWSHLNLPLLFIPKVYGNLCSHQQNSTIKRTLKKNICQWTCVQWNKLNSSHTPSSWVMNDETFVKKLSHVHYWNTDKKKETKNNTDNCKAFCVARGHKKNVQVNIHSVLAWIALTTVKRVRKLLPA